MKKTITSENLHHYGTLLLFLPTLLKMIANGIGNWQMASVNTRLGFSS